MNRILRVVSVALNELVGGLEFLKFIRAVFTLELVQLVGKGFDLANYPVGGASERVESFLCACCGKQLGGF